MKPLRNDVRAYVPGEPVLPGYRLVKFNAIAVCTGCGAHGYGMGADAASADCDARCVCDEDTQ